MTEPTPLLEPAGLNLSIRHPGFNHGSRPLTVLALGPHVDDVEIGCGATLLLLKRFHGAEIHVRVFSDHYSVPNHQDRRAEGRAAAHLMDYDSFEYFQHVDTKFPLTWAQIQLQVAGLRHELQPDLVLTPQEADAHQDHVTLAQAVRREFRYGENVWSYEITQFGTDNHSFAPNLYIDVGLRSNSPHREFREHVAAAAPGDAFGSQDTLAHEKVFILRETMASQRHKPLLQARTLLSIMSVRAMQASPTLQFAEAFLARTVLYTGQPGEQPAARSAPVITRRAA